MQFIIDKSIFEHFVGMKIVVATVKGLGATPKSQAIDEQLNKGWQIAREAATAYGNPQSHPFVKVWGEAMRGVGVSRKKFPSSIEALVRRAGKSESPFKINPLVDFYNGISMGNLVPAGGFDLDALNHNLELRFSREGDTFLALDSDEAITLPEGEVCYADGSEIITRHFVWKQSKHAILKPDSENIVLVSEILGGLPQEVVTKVEEEFFEGLKDYFGVEPTITTLDGNNCSVSL